MISEDSDRSIIRTGGKINNTLSSEPEARYLPSGENFTTVTAPVCLVMAQRGLQNSFLGNLESLNLRSSGIDQIRTLPSRPPEASLSPSGLTLSVYTSFLRFSSVWFSHGSLRMYIRPNEW
ncbi:hypothetical protein WICPIJ_003515 [Wickerhamomyces pijperi]|uniref:Uncharacterized protein n=1 Tax=Wickerhamomyces pijperi TaxID=599730 RepID=A0A9P8Q7Q2_WICPI|nr:hypothetical protein WICPIJ_003515 [Wickerhamomyces pijperi]